MNPENLISLLGSSADRPGQRTPACPDEHQAAAYADSTLALADCDSLETHLADCGWCLSVVGFLSREREAPAVGRVSETDLGRAQQFVNPERRRWSGRTSGWAAAAAVAFLSLAVTQYSLLSGLEDRSASTPTAARTTRNVMASLPTLQVLSPGAGGRVDRQRPLFRWSAVAGSDYYDVRIVTDSGDPVAEQRVDGTEWQPTAPLALKPDAEYFVQVEAHPSQAKTVSSEHVPFLVSD
jgi:hypothetical protein